MVTPTHVAVLSKVIDSFGTAIERVSGVRGHVRHAEVVSPTMAVAMTSAMSGVMRAMPAAMTGGRRAVPIAVARGGGSVTAAVIRLSTQDVAGGVALLAHQRPRGVRVAGEKRGGEKVKGVDGVPMNVGGITEAAMLGEFLVRLEQWGELRARAPEGLSNPAATWIELKICHSYTLQNSHHRGTMKIFPQIRKKTSPLRALFTKS